MLLMSLRQSLCPSNIISPLSGVVIWFKILMNVDLPAPLGPKSP